MAASPEPRGTAPASRWATVAAVLLALQGFTTIFYAGFIPPPVSDAGVTVPFLGHLPFVWIVLGGIAIAAAVGVMRRRTWGRYLGTAVELLSFATAVMAAPSLPGAALALVFPAIVLFALWRRWPSPGSA